MTSIERAGSNSMWKEAFTLVSGISPKKVYTRLHDIFKSTQSFPYADCNEYTFSTPELKKIETVKEVPQNIFYSDTIPHLLEKIAKALVEASSQDFVVITDNGAEFVACEYCVRPTLERAVSLMHSGVDIHPIEYKSPFTTKLIQNTVQHLYTIFGRKRIHRTCDRWKINLDDKISGNMPFTKRELEIIFAASCEVFKRDLQELLKEVHSSLSTIRFLDTKDMEKLAELNLPRTLDECEKVHIDALMTILIPFNKIKDIFLNTPPPYQIGDLKSAELTWEGLRDRVYTYETMRRMNFRDYLWVLLMAKGLASREPPLGAIVIHKYGYYENFELIQQGGAWKYLFKHFGKKHEKVLNLVLFRGTRFPKSVGDTWNRVFETVQEDLRSCIGSKGPTMTYDISKKLYYKKSYGFVDSENEPLRGIGISVGGTHLLREIALFPGKFLIANPVRCTGIDPETDEHFAHSLESLQLYKKPVIKYFIEDFDVVDEMGEVRLGAACKADHLRIKFIITGLWPESAASKTTLNKTLVDVFNERPRPESFFKAIKAYQKSADGPHSAPTFALDHYVIKLSDKVKEDKKLIRDLLMHNPPLHNPTWEKLRSVLEYDKQRKFIDFLHELSKERVRDENI